MISIDLISFLNGSEGNIRVIYFLFGATSALTDAQYSSLKHISPSNFSESIFTIEAAFFF